MKFTIFGASGLIGSFLAAHLRMLGHSVSAISRSNMAEAKGDLGHCIYAIGLTADFRTRPFDTIEAHVTLPTTLLREASFESFLYLSSTRVYANSTEADEGTMLSALPSNPSDLYNFSKLTGESICLSCGRKNVRIARISNVVAPSEARSHTFVGELCREAHRGHIQLRSALSSSKDYIWIADVVDLLIRIATNGKSTVYNVASGLELSHETWVSRISASTSCSVAVDVDAPIIDFPRISTRLVEKEFGYVPSAVLDFLPTILDP